MDNWKTYPLHRPEENKIYRTINIKGEEHELLFKNNFWYELNGRITINTPIRFRNEN